MKANLYKKVTHPTETSEHSLPMAECEDGKHYPVMTPVTQPEMVGEQEGRVLTIRNEEYFVLDSQQHLLACLYDTRKFIR